MTKIIVAFRKTILKSEEERHFAELRKYIHLMYIGPCIIVIVEE